MNTVKILGGKVELRDDSGTLIKTLGNGDIISACMNNDGSMILITEGSGKTQLLNEDGTFIRTIGNGDAKSAIFYGNSILIITNNDVAELRSDDDEIRWIL